MSETVKFRRMDMNKSERRRVYMKEKKSKEQPLKEKVSGNTVRISGHACLFEDPEINMRIDRASLEKAWKEYLGKGDLIIYKDFDHSKPVGRIIRELSGLDEKGLKITATLKSTVAAFPEVTTSSFTRYGFSAMLTSDRSEFEPASRDPEKRKVLTFVSKVEQISTVPSRRVRKGYEATEEKEQWILNLTEAEWEQKKKESRFFRDCAVCGARLVMNLCHFHEKKYYCEEHCPKHTWQSDFDWPTECARCGLHYEQYLQKLLDDNKIPHT